MIIRDPNGYADSFQDLAHSLDLHSVSYVIGWSAWLDITQRESPKLLPLTLYAASKGSTRKTS